MSVYSRATLGAADNQIVFNDYTLDPVYRVKARAPSRWQLRQQDLPVPFESGSSDFLTLIGDSAYIISGTMYPSSETSYDAGLAALRTACSLDVEQADAATDTGYVSYAWGNADGDLSQQVFVKPLYVQLAETTTQGFVQPFTIYCKVKDPTIFGGTAKSASTAPADFSHTTGNATLPAALPLIIGSSSFSVSSIATNNGTLPVYPQSIVVHGPVNFPRITNSASGEFIAINVNLPTSSDVMTLTYDKDTLDLTYNGASVISDLTSDSTLFKIQPGANPITMTGTSISTGAYCVVNYLDAWPLS